jgi:hypothetical protein
LDKLDDNETVGNDSRERAMRIVSQKVNSSSITSKFTSLDRDVALKKKTNSPEVRIPKKSSKLAHIKQLLKKNDTTEEGTLKTPVLVLKETSDDDDSIGTSGVGAVTSLIGKHFPKSLGSPMVSLENLDIHTFNEMVMYLVYSGASFLGIKNLKKHQILNVSLKLSLSLSLHL